MSTAAWVILIVLILLILAVVAYVVTSRRKVRVDQDRAASIRTEAQGQAAQLPDTQLRAKEAEVQAERARLDAQRAEDEAARVNEEATVQQAQYEDRLREADKIDPRVDHRAPDYAPGTREVRSGTSEARPDAAPTAGERS